MFFFTTRKRQAKQHDGKYSVSVLRCFHVHSGSNSFPSCPLIMKIIRVHYRKFGSTEMNFEKSPADNLVC